MSYYFNVSLLFFWRLFAFVMIALAVFGAIKFYTPVPFMDMWNGYLEFYLRAVDGDSSAWLAQHNEHRIFLSRILFWIDMEYFEGLSYFLVAVNYLILTLIAFIFLVLFKAHTSHLNSGYIKDSLAAILVALIFSWVQKDNLIWAFQSQFLLVQLLPVLMLFFFYKADKVKRFEVIYFTIGCIAGVASAGSMASGILALPMGFLYFAIVNRNKVRLLVTLILSVLIIALYFKGYTSPPGHGSVLFALKNDPVGMFKYSLLYLGSPFYFFLGGTSAAKAISMIASVFFLILYAIAVFKNLFLRNKNEISIILTIIILYILATAFGTAGGRLIFGVDQALTSRYTTPAIVAWTSLLILYAANISNAFKEKKILFNLGLIIIATPLIIYQLSVFKGDGNRFEESLAVLSLELGARDDAITAPLFPLVDLTIKIAEEARNRKISIFGVYPFAGLREQVGAKVSESPNAICRGNVDGTKTLNLNNNYLKIWGWIDAGSYGNTPTVMPVTNESNLIIGFVIMGKSRLDLDANLGPRFLYSGFEGYLNKILFQKSKLINIVGINCRLLNKTEN